MVGDLLSAEGVAINLLKRFSEQKLPKASELDWLVSEQEVPQKVWFIANVITFLVFKNP